MNYESNDAASDRITLLTVLSFWPPRTWNSLFERARYQLAKLKKLSETEELMLVRTSSDLQTLRARRQGGDSVVGAIYLIEGAHPLEGELEKLDMLFDEGLRIVGLTHFF